MRCASSASDCACFQRRGNAWASSDRDVTYAQSTSRTSGSFVRVAKQYSHAGALRSPELMRQLVPAFGPRKTHGAARPIAVLLGGGHNASLLEVVQSPGASRKLDPATACDQRRPGVTGHRGQR
jgi:hypothetical protein